MLKQTIALVGLTLSLSVNAAVQNTLNGVDYEWLELTETVGLSRDQVEARLLDSNDALFGYEYASRQLFENLLESYITWDSLDGWHGNAAVIAGYDAFRGDFGSTAAFAGNGGDVSLNTVDVGSVSYRGGSSTNGLYGKMAECAGSSCRSVNTSVIDSGDETVAVSMLARYGWDSTVSDPYLYPNSSRSSIYGSFLVTPSAVPVPAAGWLFMSALLGLVGKKRLSRQ